MERKLGEVFEFEGKKIKCVEDVDLQMCKICFIKDFELKSCYCISDVIGVCSPILREDSKNIVFKEVE
jgi:hypothetical protein